MHAPESIWARLAEPFPEDEIQARPGSVTKDGTRAMILHYIDARSVMDRLDSVLGPSAWQDDYTVLPDGNVHCKLSFLSNGQWITKQDIGGPSDQSDGGDRLKAAFSDALKRAAVKLGIGRYLYSLPQMWGEYDSQKKRFTKLPTLPSWALPKPQKPAKPVQPSNGPVERLPHSWDDWKALIACADERLLEAKKITSGDFVAHVKALLQDEINQEVLPKSPAEWSEAQIRGVLATLAQVEEQFRTREEQPA